MLWFHLLKRLDRLIQGFLRTIFLYGKYRHWLTHYEGAHAKKVEYVVVLLGVIP